jgi:NAD(P)-dependent dehydrogenase (short-subunit alcohol dehydrogenase family)
MDLQLSGKKALVTGSTAGIGLAIGAALAAEGAAVILNGRTQPRVDAAIKQILSKSPGASVTGVAIDLGTAVGAAKLFDEVPDLDILVNNLGIFKPTPFHQISDEEWQHFFDVNVMSGVRLSRFYLPKLLAKNWGRIVFISSESGLNVPPEMIHYGFTKTAQLAIARGLAETTAGSAVTVNSVLPGPTLSEGVETYVQKLAEAQNMPAAEVESNFFKHARPTSLLRRLAEPEEVAATVAFLCSPLASVTNGAAVRVEGGLLRHFG